ncbi:MAG: thioredoxin family protein [Verrucomicrobiota bacterium]
MIPTRVLPSLAALVIFTMPAVGRTWKEAGSDRVIEGDYVRTEDGKAVIVLSNGSSVKVPLLRLSEEDQKFVVDQAAAKVAQEAAKAAAASNVFKWETDFDVAKQRARDEKKPMLLDFTGSDWCGWCMKLKKEVFDTPEFRQYAKDKLVLVEVDFPHTKRLPKALKEQNEKLAQEYGIHGYPTITLLDPQGAKVAETGYQEGGPEKYIEHLKSLLK